MKKYIFSLVLTFVAVQFTYAQDLNSFMSEFSKQEGVQRQLVDRSMLDMSMKAAMTADSTGQMVSKMPAFMQKIDSIEVLAIEKYSPEVKTKFLEGIQSFKDGNGYATLLSVNEADDNVKIVSHKEGDLFTGVYILVLDNEDAVIVKMSGNLTESDLTEILKEQNKNK